jgi:hypothetical protein
MTSLTPFLLHYCSILLLLSLIIFMQGTYNYIPETRQVSRVNNGAACLLLQFIVDTMLFPTINVLYFYISTFRSMWAVLNMAVFCCSLICFPGMLPRYVCTYVYVYYYYYLLHLDWYSVCVWCLVHTVPMPVVTIIILTTIVPIKQKSQQANNCPSFLHYLTSSS